MTPETAFRHWYDATFGADHPNGTEFDSGEMFDAFAAGWAAALPALTGAITAQATTAERERFLSVLAEHYLMMVICDPVKKLDNPACGCSRVFLGWHPTVGAAHQAYIDHFADVLADVPDGDTNE